MKLKSKFLNRFHLDKQHALLPARVLQVIIAMFDMIDIHNNGCLNDLQFLAFMQYSTDLQPNQIYKVFDMFDCDGSGTIEFDEFYLLICMLIAIKDGEEKHFLWRHFRTCYELLDKDGSGAISIDEFAAFGYIFSITKDAATQIFRDFDVDGSKELDYEEFQMFTVACLDAQREIELTKQVQERIASFCLIL